MQNPSSHRRALRPPQFTLRTLIGLITLLAVLFALVNVVHPLVLAGLILLVLLIAAHITGNALGTRLREIGSRPVDERGRDLPPQTYLREVGQDEFAAPTQLARRMPLGLPVLVVSTAGAVLGGLGGGLWGWQAGSTPHIAVGGVAFAVLGGLGSFALFSFSQVMLGAYWQALKQSGKEEAGSGQLAESGQKQPR